jgi:hypothetical protein
VRRWRIALQTAAQIEPLLAREAAIAQREAEIRAKIDELASFQASDALCYVRRSHVTCNTLHATHIAHAMACRQRTRYGLQATQCTRVLSDLEAPVGRAVMRSEPRG